MMHILGRFVSTGVVRPKIVVFMDSILYDAPNVLKNMYENRYFQILSRKYIKRKLLIYNNFILNG